MAQEDDARWAGLMVAAQQGDRRSYERLLHEVIPVLKRFVSARWRTAQASEIDDVVQETLKSLHSARHTYIPGRAFLPWLLAIARYRLLDEQRRTGRRWRRETEFDPDDETNSTVTTNTSYDRAAEGSTLRQAIAELPPAQRTALELLKLQEMSLKEASVASGMSIAALKVATHRAIKTLKVILGGDR